jgi:hypothetical protein
MAGFIKLVMIVLAAALLAGGYIHYSTGALHTRFDPKLQDLLAILGEWVPGLSDHSN